MNIVAILNDFPYLFRHVENQNQKSHMLSCECDQIYVYCILGTIQFLLRFPDQCRFAYRHWQSIRQNWRNIQISMNENAISNPNGTRLPSDSFFTHWLRVLINSKWFFFKKKKLKSILEINRWCCWLVGHLRTFSYVTSWSMFMLDLITLLYS